MALKICKCCGQEIPGEPATIPEKAKLTRIQIAIFEAVSTRPGKTVPWHTVEDAVYGDDPEGGPLTARGSIQVMRWRANKKLRPLGYEIESVFGIGLRLRVPQASHDPA